MLSRSNTWFRGAGQEKKAAVPEQAAAPAPTPAPTPAPPYPVDEHEHVSIPTRSSTLPMTVFDAPPATRNEPVISDASADVLHLTQTSELLTERLQAWKHAVSYLEDYIGATEKVHKAHAKEYEKVLKVCHGIRLVSLKLLIRLYRQFRIH